MLLARQGHEDLVIDRASFPSDIIPMVLEQAQADVHGEGSGGCPLSAMLSKPHNEGMDIKATPPSSPGLALAGSLLEALAAGDFDRLAAVFDDDASVSALLPGGFRVWNGAAEIAAVFEGWFGDVEDYELIDASVGQVGARLQLRWQLRLRGARLGSRARVVEQYAYADTASSGRIHRMALHCSGFCREHLNA
jgi:ketosteroid isomerase-like protein